jgi:hypothetical protein
MAINNSAKSGFRIPPKEHQHGSLHRAELLQLLFYRIPELPFGKLLLRVRTGVGKATPQSPRV